MGDNKIEPGAQVTYYEVGEAESGQRIDNFLIKKLKGVPKSRIYRILRKGEVRVNKGRIKALYKLSEGDIVRIPPVRTSHKVSASTVSSGLEAMLRQSFLYEDDRLLVVNKPSGLAVHGGSGINLGLIEAIRLIRPEARFLELVHRLDRDTSGCIMIAKKRSMLRYLHQLLRDGGIDKRYLALAPGRWPNRRKIVSAALEKNTLKSGERMVKVSEAGKPSVTHFDIVERFDQATLLEAKPITGRTHQIRVHALHVGHPLLGDEKYGNTDANNAFRAQGLKRLFLHAASLTVPMPDDQEELKIAAPLSADLQSLLDTLRD
jgi:23S rRNA pseudouridine955/2504/2580 synthase